MGLYITIDDLKERVGATDLSALVDELGVSEETLLNNVIARAEGMVNGYAGKIYKIPIPVSPVIKELCLSITDYELHKRGMGGDVPKKYKDSYDEVRKILIDMAKGDFVPPPGEDGSIPEIRVSGGMSLDIQTDNTLFTQAEFNGSDQSFQWLNQDFWGPG